MGTLGIGTASTGLKTLGLQVTSLISNQHKCRKGVQITQVPEKNRNWSSRKGFVPTLLKEQQLKQPLSLGNVSLPS